MKTMQPDSALLAHYDIISSSAQFVNKVNYSLTCVIQSVNFQNSNRAGNLSYVMGWIPLLIGLMQKHNNQQLHQLSLCAINIIKVYNKTTPSQELSILETLLQVQSDEQHLISQKHTEEIIKILRKISQQQQVTRFVCKFVSTQHVSKRLVYLMFECIEPKSMRLQQLDQLIQIGVKRINDSLLLLRVLSMIQWMMCNHKVLQKDVNRCSRIVQVVQSWIKQHPTNNTLHYNIYLIIFLIELNNPTALKQSSKHQTRQYLLKLMQNPVQQRKIYLPYTDVIIQLPKEYLQALNNQHNYHIIIDHLAKFGATQEFQHILTADIKNSNTILPKKFAFRTIQNSIPQNQWPLVKITAQEEIKNCQNMPIACLRSVNAFKTKLLKQNTPANALQMLASLNNISSRDSSLLLQLHKVYIHNKSYLSLRQVQKMVIQQYSQNFINFQNKNIYKEYFIWIPILCSNQNITSHSSQISEIFLHETVSIPQKFYVANFLLRKMQEQPLHKFITYLLRQMQQNSILIFKELSYYLGQRQEWMTQSHLHHWLEENFRSQLQKMLQNILSKLVVIKTGQVSKILFSLQNLHAYGQIWLRIFRWILVSLEQIDIIYPEHTLDCLQILQMILEQIQLTTMPTALKQRFISNLRRNWIYFRHTHYFTLERILDLMYPQKVPEKLIPSYKIQSIKNLKKQNKSKDENYTPILSEYLEKVSYNAFFGYIQKNQTIIILNNLLKQSQNMALEHECIQLILSMLLWLFQYSDDDLPSCLNEVLVSMLHHVDSRQLQEIKSCLQIINTVGHSINLLKLPIHKMLHLYYNEQDHMHHLTQIIKIVADSKPKAIQIYELDNFINLTLIRLITLKKLSLINEYISFIETTCLIQCRYAHIFEKKMNILNQILVAEMCGVEAYRKELVLFSLQNLEYRNYCIHPKLLCFLLQKYFEEIDIVEIILELLEQKTITSFLNKKILVRLVLTHNREEGILTKCKQVIFKMEEELAVNQNNHVIPEEQFNKGIQNGQYNKCQDLIDDISNPYQIKVDHTHISKLLKEHHPAKTQKNYNKLIRFLFENPQSKCKMLSCSQLYEIPYFINYICSLEEALQSDQKLDRIKITQFNAISKIYIIELSELLGTISKTYPYPSNNFLPLILNFDSCDKNKKLLLLSFYSRLNCKNKQRAKKFQKQLNNIDNDTLMELHIPIKAQKLNDSISTNILIRHFLTHYQCLHLDPNSINDNTKYINQIVLNLVKRQWKHDDVCIFLARCYNLNSINSRNINFAGLCAPISSYFNKRKEGTQIQQQMLYGLLAYCLFMCKNKIVFLDAAFKGMLIDFLSKTKNQLQLKAYEDIMSCTQVVKTQINTPQPKKKEELQQSKTSENVLNQNRLQQQNEENKDQYNIEQVVETNNQSYVNQKLSEINFDQKSFYLKQQTGDSPNQKVRLNNLKNVEQITKDQMNITTIKEHGKFLSAVQDYSQLTSKEFQQLIASIHNVTQTVQSHHYYCKKVIDMDLIPKLIKLYQRSKVILSTQNEIHQLQVALVDLCKMMSYKKQKKMVIFGDKLTIQFFKVILKISINDCKDNFQAQSILSIMGMCTNNTEQFYRQGLISMVVELGNRGVCISSVLDYFISLDLNPNVINEIYQRGLLNKMVQQISQPSNNEQILNLWIRLAAKICIKPAVQQRYKQKNLHIILRKKIPKQRNTVKYCNLAYFYAQLCHKNDVINDWLQENKIPQIFFEALKAGDHEQMYMLFYKFCDCNSVGRQYCFRIGYHFHLIALIKQQQQLRSKYFYKSLAQMMLSSQHHSLFFKEHTIKSLLYTYNTKPQCTIYEAFQYLIMGLQTDREFQLLRQEGFWQSSIKLFQTKLVSEVAYTYFLKIMICMVRKGQLKDVNTAEMRKRSILKADYSINLEGKELALYFILQLSHQTRQNFVSQRCMSLISSLFNFGVSKKSLDILLNILSLQGTSKCVDLFYSLFEHQVTAIICDSFGVLGQHQKFKTLECLFLLSSEPHNNILTCQRMLGQIVSLINGTSNQQLYSISFRLIVSFLSVKDNHYQLQNTKLYGPILKFIKKTKTHSLEQYILQFIVVCQKNNIMQQNELISLVDQIMKYNLHQSIPEISKLATSMHQQLTKKCETSLEVMKKGLKVIMYKNDGSLSELILFLSPDGLQINCGVTITAPVKLKWRMPLNEINEVILYDSKNKQFQSTPFHKSAGLFTKAPQPDLCATIKAKNITFYVCFPSKEIKVNWLQMIKLVQNNTFNQLAQLK